MIVATVMPLLQMVTFVVILDQVSGPLDCRLTAPTAASCSNGATVALQDDGRLLFKNGVTFGRTDAGHLGYSNGVSGRFDSFGWVEFSNGMGMREMSDGSMKFTNELICREVAADRVTCKKE